MRSNSIVHWEVNVMFKKFFAAVIIAVFLSSLQIAFAANNYYDWSKIKHISSKSELAHYLESQSRAGQTVIPVVLTNGLSIPFQETILICPGSRLMQEIVSGDGRNTRIVYTLKGISGYTRRQCLSQRQYGLAFTGGDGTGQKLSEGTKWFSVMTPYDEKFATENFSRHVGGIFYFC